MKKILITQKVECKEDIKEMRDVLAHDWYTLALNCGFLPIIAPNNLILTKELLSQVKIDGIILSGGNTLHKYGGDTKDRDELEHFLIDYALLHNIKILGVCRGMQVILDYFKVNLYPVINHVRVCHELDDGSIVNSYHNYGAYEVKKPLIALKYASNDKVVEAITCLNHKNLKAVMWHPERSLQGSTQDIQLIKDHFEL